MHAVYALFGMTHCFLALTFFMAAEHTYNFYVPWQVSNW
jgi:hypothetical protein